MKRLLCFLFIAAATLAAAIQGVAGPYRIDLQTIPYPAPVGRATLQITLKDTNGKPVGNAVIKVLAQMPGMSMGEREETATPAETPGAYTAPAVFSMSGAYDVHVSIAGPLGNAQTTLNLTTNESDKAFSPWFIVVIVVILIAGAIQIKRSGQKPNWKSLFSPQVLWSLVMLATALGGAVWVVHTFRRPGSMTPLEAQTMDMSAPAPEGTLPVKLAQAELKPFGTTVTYAGQAVAFAEQDIVTRVGGAITWMPLYTGNPVKKGQLLAKIDTTQIDPVVSEKQAGVNTATKAVSVATLESQQAANAIAQAKAELAAAEGAQAEAKAMQEASHLAATSAEDQIKSAQAEVASMRAESASADADLNYQTQELRRMRDLFDKGAISKDEWQQAQAEAQKARAAATKAREQITKAQTQVDAARAESQKAKAEVAAATQRLRQAAAAIQSKQAAVATAESAAQAAQAKIAQAHSTVAEAQAILQGATTQRGYAEIHADADGVVTMREISPGVVVTPGQSLLKIAQISPIRLQANVPETDLAKIHLGNNIKFAGLNQELRITSISPTVDPTTRMGIVEALYPNKQAHFHPGQILSATISTQEETQATVIPADAVQTEENNTYVWLAEPSTNNRYTVSRHPITVGGRSNDLIAIKTGVQPGQQVVVSPPQSLDAGSLVTSMNPTKQETKAEQTIEITAAGYNPPTINIPNGKPLRLTFIRRDDKTCGTEVIFPDLQIRKALPLNKPVVVDLPPQPAGKTLNFTCPMNMLNGTAVSQ